MGWIADWWRQIVGPPVADGWGENPWEDDPRIREARRDQHDRINKAQGIILRDEFHRRLRESWRA